MHTELIAKQKQPAQPQQQMPAPFPVYTQHPFQPTIGCPRFEHPPCLELECVASPKSSSYLKPLWDQPPFEGLRNDKTPVATVESGGLSSHSCQYFVVASILRPLDFIEITYIYIYILTIFFWTCLFDLVSSILHYAHFPCALDSLPHVLSWCERHAGYGELPFL